MFYIFHFPLPTINPQRYATPDSVGFEGRSTLYFRRVWKLDYG